MAQSTAPMREPTYFTLAALLDGPLHGYAIAKRVEVVSDGRVHVTAGTLYAALERLLERGLVAVDGEEVVRGRARRYYRLTPAGDDALRAEATRLSEAASVVVSRMSVPEPAPEPAS
jgi:PadR family transcriptional regulator PadR